MIGDLFLGFIVLCMAFLVAYPLFNLVTATYRERRSRR